MYSVFDFIPYLSKDEKEAYPYSEPTKSDVAKVLRFLMSCPSVRHKIDSKERFLKKYEKERKKKIKKGLVADFEKTRKGGSVSEYKQSRAYHAAFANAVECDPILLECESMDPFAFPDIAEAYAAHIEKQEEDLQKKLSVEIQYAFMQRDQMIKQQFAKEEEGTIAAYFKEKFEAKKVYEETKEEFYKFLQVKPAPKKSLDEIAFRKLLEDYSSGSFFFSMMANTILKRNKEFHRFASDRKKVVKQIVKRLQEQTWESLLLLEKETIAKILLKNKNLQTSEKEVIKKELQILEDRKHIKSELISAIPKDPTLLFPVARMMKRHFYLHIGPTNSGKTHDSIEAFKAADSAIYFAPLRLLAFEIYCECEKSGVKCSMKTGEEERIKEGAKHMSCTVEMFYPDHIYDLAVIDEAQLVSDSKRGGSFTAAILGVPAKEVHVCAAPQALPILKQMIISCADDFTVIEHHRSVPLVLEDKPFYFPQSVRSKDACIVFSKRKVLSYAKVLEENGIPCSVIYGALPYDVRQREIQRFLSGETKVVVATDAIGMGLNLPIRRIVFLEQSKFDGECVRPLEDEEVRQIAGRAGRFGVYPVGYYTSEFGKKSLEEKYNAKRKEIKQVYLRFPRTLVGVGEKLSNVMQEWNELPNVAPYIKENNSREIVLSEMLEEYTNDKELIYSFVTIPFDETKDELLRMWKKLFFDKLSGHIPTIPTPSLFPELSFLELQYQKFDLLYAWFDRFDGDKEKIQDILLTKEEISNQISQILSQPKADKKKRQLQQRA